jgi:hypothetical protein
MRGAAAGVSPGRSVGPSASIRKASDRSANRLVASARPRAAALLSSTIAAFC